MNIKTVTSDEVTIIELSGNLDANTVPQVQDEIMSHVTPDCHLVLDMTECQYVSSSGLRVLLMIAKRVRANGSGQWCLANVSEDVMDVIEMTGFAQFFEIADTVLEAIEAVQQGA